METIVNSNASFTWKGILKGRRVQKLGYRLRVGSGNSIRICQDPWLSSSRSFRVASPPAPNHFQPDALVCSLINPHWRRWNKQLEEEIFRPVLAIPLGSFSATDRWVWHFSRHVDFTVCSGYQAALSSTEFNTGHGWDPLSMVNFAVKYVANFELANIKSGLGNELEVLLPEMESERFIAAVGDITEDTKIQPDHVEILAARLAVELVRESDLSVLGPLEEDSRSMLKTLEYWEVKWRSRAGNVVAHHIAQMAKALRGKSMWRLKPPSSLLPALLEV
ncbi:hypothetical protein ACH5RR_008577 [Cinchona calisaya]|uniref:RNase H type-1 domain-containing protein n=1 Tax=Cinchona calisaya TaxID=153742 RepID=A0ABD3AFD4_9GENT